MSEWDEKAEDFAVAHHTYEHMDRATNARLWFAIKEGARWQREALLSDETVVRAARAVAGLGPGENWPTNAEMGGGPTGTRDDEYRDACMEAALSVLTAALGEDEGDE